MGNKWLHFPSTRFKSSATRIDDYDLKFPKARFGQSPKIENFRFIPQIETLIITEISITDFDKLQLHIQNLAQLKLRANLQILKSTSAVVS